MMKTLKAGFALAACASVLVSARASVVTLQVHTAVDGAPIITNSEVTIASNQIAEVQARYSNGPDAAGYWIKDGVTNLFPLSDTVTVGNGSGTYGIAWATPVIIAGPAIIRLTGRAGFGASANVTLKIEPEAFPPGSTVVIPAGSGATIYLEASPDLVTWTNAAPGAYTNLTIPALFFRIRADRLTP